MFQTEPNFMNYMDVVNGSIYDSNSYAAGSTIPQREYLFRSPIGQEGKTLLHTNMELSSQLPMPMMQSIQRIKWVFARTCLAKDVLTYLENTMTMFWMGCKRYTQSPLLCLPAQDNSVPPPIWTCAYCSSVYVGEVCPGCGARDRDFFDTRPEETVMGYTVILDLKGMDLVIIQQIHFYMEHEHPYSQILTPQYEGGTGLRYWVHLDGLTARGIQ
jgi:hypothetical protein